MFTGINDRLAEIYLGGLQKILGIALPEPAIYHLSFFIMVVLIVTYAFALEYMLKQKLEKSAQFICLKAYFVELITQKLRKKLP